MSANKVKFGLEKCYYAVATINNGAVTYATPVAMLGAVSLNFAPSGTEATNFSADNIYDYYVSGNASSFFSGDLEMALIGDDFKKDVLGYAEDTNGVIYQSANATKAKFALLFQFSGDVKNVRHVLYNCSATDVAINSQTTTDIKEPVTDTVTITASASPETNIIHAYLEEETSTNYTNWFSSVYTVAS